MRIALGLLIAASAFGAVNGIATNGTTGKPQAGVSINLVQPGAQGMQQLGQAKSGPDGSFFRGDQVIPGFIQS